MEYYSALIIDIKNSRKYEENDRGSIQNYIKESITLLNDLFRPALKFEIIFSGGDEVQGLFSNPSAAFLYYRLLNMIIHPVKTRAGLGIGSWDIKIIGGSSTEQDGSAYHNARNAINKDNEKDDYNLIVNSGDEDDIFVNTYLNASSLLMNLQTEKQSQLLLLIELLYPIIKSDSMDMDFLASLNDLIHKKTRYEYFSKNNWTSIQNDDLAIQEIGSNYILNYTFNHIGRIKGLTNQLVKITGATRQNIEKTMKAGNVNQIREINIVTLKIMDKLYSGGSL